MSRFRPFIAAALLALAAALPAAAADIAGQRFADRVRLGDSELLLNGLGLRAVAWIKGYAAGLYLPRPVRAASDAIALQGPKRIELRMLLDVPAAEFSKAFRKGIERNTSEAERAAMQERAARFDRTIVSIGSVKKGDVVDIDYQPGRGVTISVNGAIRGEAIAGDDLFVAILKSFIGEHPVDAKLKAGLLGVKSA